MRRSVHVLIPPDVRLDHDRSSGDIESYIASASSDAERFRVGWVVESCLDDLRQGVLDCPIIAKTFHVAFALQAFLGDAKNFRY